MDDTRLRHYDGGKSIADTSTLGVIAGDVPKTC
jgi:hypothetical protein